MAGRKPSGTWIGAKRTATKAINPDHHAREAKAAAKHFEEEALRLAVAFRLEEYASQRVLSKMISGHPREDWLRKVRKAQKGNVALLPPTLTSKYDDCLIELGLPPLE